MAMKLPGVSISIADGGLAKTGGSIGAIGIIGTGKSELQKVVPVVSVQDARKFGEGSVLRACSRIFEMGGAQIISYAVPENASADVYLAGVDALIANHVQKECIAIVDATDENMWANIITKVENAAHTDRFLYAVVQTRQANTGEDDSTYAAALINERGNSIESERLAVCAGSVIHMLPDGSTQRVPIIDTILGTISQREPWENIEAVKFGALKAVKMPGEQWGDSELANLLSKGYITVRRFYGRTGIYITLARLATPERSDFDILSKIRVLNRVSNVVRDVQLEYVNDTLPANDGGANLLKTASEIPLRSMKNNGEFTDFAVNVDISKLITDREVSTSIEIVPLGTASTITTTIKYTVEV